MADTPIRARSGWSTICLGLAAGALLVGCGGDGDEGDATAPADPPAESVDGGDVFCDTFLAVSGDTGPDVDFESASEEEISAALEAYAEAFLPKLRALEAAAPAGLAEATRAYTGTYEEVLATGDDSAFDDGFLDAERSLVDAAIDGCATDVIDVVTTDYAFDGVPPSVEAGRVGLRLTNEGAEVHEALVYRRLAGATEPADALLELPEEEQASKLEFVAVAFVAPGSAGAALLELEPSDYVVACLVPVGTTTTDAEVDGPPHTSEGMVAEFTVVG